MADSQARSFPDLWLISAALCFAALSVVMVMSASGIMADQRWGDKFFFIKKQALFSGVGIVVMFAMSRISPQVLYRLTYPIVVATLILVGLTLIPSLGVKAGGASRWLRMGPFSFQPLESAKIGIVLYLAYFYSHKQELVKTFSVGFLPPLLVTGIYCLLLLQQPDFGGAVYLAMLFFLISLAGGTRIIYLFSSVGLTLTCAVSLVLNSPYRFRRWFAFLDPFKDAQDSGYQLVQSLYALGNGGWTGMGLGSGNQKLFFLPDAHNDFILAILGEELGFMGISVVFCLIGIFIWRSFKIAIEVKGMQDRLVAYGFGSILALGCILNAAVVLGAVPPKGIPMPFLSYGGSQVVFSFFCIGVLLSLSRFSISPGRK